MRIDIITVLPEMLEGFFNCSIMSRAQKKGIAEIHIRRSYPDSGYTDQIGFYRYVLTTNKNNYVL